MATTSPVFLFKRVKHGTQNIKNDCHQWLSDGFRVHQIRFLSGLRPGPRWGSLQRSPRPHSWFKEAYFKGGERQGEGKGKGRGRKREGPTPLRKFLDAPLELKRCIMTERLLNKHDILRKLSEVSVKRLRKVVRKEIIITSNILTVTRNCCRSTLHKKKLIMNITQ